MANRNATVSSRSSGKGVVVSWTGLLNTDIGIGVAGQGHIMLPAYPDRTVQLVVGTAGAGLHVLIEGSNDGGTTWATLTDPLGNSLDFTAAGMKQITELPDRIRPRVSGGDVTTTVSVYIACRGEAQSG